MVHVKCIKMREIQFMCRWVTFYAESSYCAKPLEMRPGVCFVGVTAISNRIQCRLEISGRRLGEAGLEASGGRCRMPVRRCIGVDYRPVRLPYIYQSVNR